MKSFLTLVAITVATVTAFSSPIHHPQHHHHPPTTSHHNFATGHHQLTSPTHHPSSALHVSWWDRDDESRHAAMHHNIMRTDVRNFLTQRSLQSFIHLCIQCRDPHTVKWLEDFGGWNNLESFHGTGAINVTTFPDWSAIFMDMMREKDDVVVVSVRKRGQRAGGSRKKNPFVQEEHFEEFTIDIDPPSLANRILAVREQIAEEWVADLDALKLSNDMVLESYNQKVKTARDTEEAAARDDDDEECDDDGSYESVECLLSAQKSPAVAFDRNAMYFLRNSNAFTEKSPSMLRQGNFDLLCLLATQESIHRVLRDYVDAGNEHEVSFQWFRDFYIERVAKFFDGNQEHGSADNFLEELLLTTPSIKAARNGKMGLVDPLRIAEDIIATRSKVAMEWKEIVSSAKDDHSIVRKELLEKQMLKWGQKPATPVEPEPELATADKEVEIFGEFQ